MIRLFWLFAWIAVVIWSLLAWAAYGVIDLFGGLAASSTDGIVAGVIGALRSLGQGAILFVWGLVSLVILGVPWLLGRAVRSGGVTHVHVRGGARRSDVIDLPPDQYVVQTPREDRRPSSREPFSRFEPPPRDPR